MPSADKRQRKKENARAAREAREAAARRKRRNRTARNVGIALVVFVGVVALVTWLSSGKKHNTASSTTTTAAPTSTTVKAVYPAGCVATVPKSTPKNENQKAPPMTIDPAKTYVAHVTTSCGAFDIQLDAKEAPKTANSFVFLAKQGFYDGLKFHRIAKDFVVQGGDPKGNGTGGPGYALPTEPPKNGYTKTSVAMANSGPGTTGSQFFLVLSDSGAKELGGPPYLYSELGNVTKGYDVVQKLGTLYNPNETDTDVSSQTTSVPLYIFNVTISES